MPPLTLAELAAAAAAAATAATPADEATADGVTALVKMMPMFSVYNLSVHAVITLAAFGANSGVVWLVMARGAAAGPAAPTTVTFVGDRAEQCNRSDHTYHHKCIFSKSLQDDYLFKTKILAL